MEAVIVPDFVVNIIFLIRRDVKSFVLIIHRFFALRWAALALL